MNEWNAREHRECAERFTVLFAEYEDHYEFIGGRTSSKGKARLRCRICGHEFDITGSFAQIHSNVRCPRCRVKAFDSTDLPRDGMLASRISIAYESGMRVLEIAEAFGLTQRAASNLVNEVAVIDTQRYKREKARARANDRIRDKERAAIGKDIRARRLLLDDLNKLRMQMHEDMEKLHAQEAAEAEYGPVKATCAHCGATFTHWRTHRRYARYKPPMYCSERCNRKASRKRTGNDGNISSRLRKYGMIDKPRDRIRLDDVIRRDGGICYLCGCETDKTDRYMTASGHYACGPKYPTIDHVKPLARGGTHTWENVRLACHACNSKKSDAWIE